MTKIVQSPLPMYSSECDRCKKIGDSFYEPATQCEGCGDFVLKCCTFKTTQDFDFDGEYTTPALVICKACNEEQDAKVIA